MKNIYKNKSKDELIERILDLEEKNDNLEKEVWKLKWQLSINSQNSSKPWSTNIFDKLTPITNSRKKWKNPRWWVKGHKWKNLQQDDNPNKVIELDVNNCEECGFELNMEKYLRKIKRQKIDISRAEKYVTEYISWVKKCPECWHINIAQFPEGVCSHVQYWENIKALSVYLNTHWMMSCSRIEQYFKEVASISVSTQSINNFNKKTFKKLEDFEKLLEKALLKSEVAHADETWVRVGWNLSWVHVISTLHHTLYKVHKNRGKKAIEEIDLLTQYYQSLVTDHWASYKKYWFKHFFCNAHHLRELSWVIENEEKSWAKELKKLLLKAKKLKELAQKKGKSFLEKEVLEDISLSYKNILNEGKKEYKKDNQTTWKRWRPKKDKWLNLLERLEKSQDWTLGYVFDFDIPFDNNLAERDLRMVKLKNKVSGCFRSSEGAEYFCRIRSYISTLRKQKKDIYAGLLSLFSWKILLPEF